MFSIAIQKEENEMSEIINVIINHLRYKNAIKHKVNKRMVLFIDVWALMCLPITV